MPICDPDVGLHTIGGVPQRLDCHQPFRGFSFEQRCRECDQVVNTVGTHGGAVLRRDLPVLIHPEFGFSIVISDRDAGRLAACSLESRARQIEQVWSHEAFATPWAIA